MKIEEKIINLIRTIARHEAYDYGIQIGEMLSNKSVSIHGMTVESTELYFIDSCVNDIATKVKINGEVKTGGGGESPHTHPFEATDKSTYTEKLKQGDKVALLRHGGKYICLGRLVSL